MKKFLLLRFGLCLSVSVYNACAQQSWDPTGTTNTTGAYGGVWDTTTKNWTALGTQTTVAASSLVAYTAGNTALFSAGPSGSTLQGTFNITNNTANLSIGSIITGADNPGYSDVTFTGTGSFSLPAATTEIYAGGSACASILTVNIPINGTGPLETPGCGSTILGAANTFTGGFDIDGSGGVSFGNNAAFGTGTITWLAFGFIQPVGSSAYTITNAMTHKASGIETFAGNSGGVIFSGPWALGSTAYVELENIAGKITVSGVISGSAALTITNKGGTWTLTGVNTFTGSLTNAGTLTIGGAGQLNSGSYAGNILNRTNFIYSSSASQTLSGVISGTGAVTQNGSGNLTLSAVETYTGGTSNGTTLIIGGAGTITAAGAITNNGTFTYNSTANETISGIISGTGALNQNGSGTLGLSGANTYSGITTVTGATLNLANSSGLDAVLGTPPGSPVTNQLVLNNGTLEVSSANLILSANRGIYLIGANSLTNNGKDATFPDNIGGTGSLTKTGANAAVLSGSNSFSGGLTILQGTVYFVTNYAAGSGDMTLGPTIGLVTMRITNASPLQTSVTIANNITVNAGGSKLIDMVAASGDTLTFSGQISGTGGLVRGNGGGPGNVALTGNNTNWSGGITLQQGGLIVGDPYALGTGTCTFEPVGSGTTAVILQASTPLTGVNALTNTVQIAASNAADQITIGGSADLELAGPVILAQAGSLAPTITNNNTGSTIISGVISSGVSGTGFTCAGTGVLTLNGTDTYNGNTTISSGTLALGASGSINSSPVISIAAGATFDTSAYAAYVLSGSTTLSASGTASPATVNGASGGTVSLGSQPITLTYDGSHPALTISQGTLVLNGNAFTVNGPVLPVGSYTIVQQASGSINSSGSYAVSGSAIGAGKVASIQVLGGNVNLIITLETPGYSGLTASQSVTYGTPAVTLVGQLVATNPATVYPSNGETVTVTINGNAQTTTINDTNGDFSINYNLAGLIYSTSPYAITYAYSGDAALYGATNTSTTLTVTPASAPGITNNPSPQTACSGSPATFTVGASGTNDTYAWYEHANAGWGSAWSASGGGGTFLASSTGNNNGAPNCDTFGSNGDINTPGGNSWGIYGGGGGESVTRTFPAVLTDGQVFQVDMDNGGVDNGVQNGFSLQNSTGGFLFSFYFQGGGSDYVFYDGNGATDTGVGYTVTGVRIQVIVGTGSPAAYSLLITPCGGSTVEFSGTFATTNGPGQVVLYNNNPYGGSANDLYFNSMFAGGAYDDADNYTNGGWNGVDAGDAAPIAGATNATYTTTNGNNGDQYYAIVGNGAGYAASATALLTLNPTPTVSVNSATVCAGDSATLTATTSASNPSYLWSDSETNASITVTPGSTTTYTVTVTDGTTGCMNSGSGTVTVNPLPTVSVNSATVCAGGSAMLTATTSASNPTYLWSDSETNASITVAPGSTTVYTVTVTDGTTGCTNSGSGTVTVNPLPTVSVNSAAVCAGGSAMLTATTSASSPSYLWSDSETTASITVSPGSTTVYTVTVTDGTTGCANGGSGTVTVNPLPTITLATNSISVVSGVTNASLAYTGTTGSPDGYSITYDTNAQAVGFSNVTLTVLPASPITLTVPAIAAGTNVYNGTLTVYYSSNGCGSTNYEFMVTIIGGTPVFTNLTASQAIPYGTASVTLTGTVSAPGPVYPTNGETITVTINGVPQTTTINDGMGDFSINYSTATLPVVTSYPGNYTITYSYGGDTVLTSASDTSTTLEVDALPVVLVGTRMYDGMTDAAAAILSVANAINGDMVTVASGSGSLVSANVGTNAILATGTLNLAGPNAGNYNITGGVGTVVVTMAPLTVTANNDSKVYGQVKTYGAGSGAFTSSPLQNGETIGTVTITASGGTAANAPIGMYSLTPSAATGGTFNPSNYAITYDPGTLTVSVLTAILTGTRPYDATAIATNSILTVSNEVVGDDVTVASGSGTLASAAVGTNMITSLGSLALGGVTATNYTLSGATGAVVITDPGLPFSITTHYMAGTNLVTVFQSIPGDVYQLLGSANAAAPLVTWTNIGAPITATNTSTTNIIPVNALNGSRSYIYKNLK